MATILAEHLSVVSPSNFAVRLDDYRWKEPPANDPAYWPAVVSRAMEIFCKEWAEPEASARIIECLVKQERTSDAYFLAETISRVRPRDFTGRLLEQSTTSQHPDRLPQGALEDLKDVVTSGRQDPRIVAELTVALTGPDGADLAFRKRKLSDALGWIPAASRKQLRRQAVRDCAWHYLDLCHLRSVGPDGMPGPLAEWLLERLVSAAWNAEVIDELKRFLGPWVLNDWIRSRLSRPQDSHLDPRPLASELVEEIVRDRGYPSGVMVGEIAKAASPDEVNSLWDTLVRLAVDGPAVQPGQQISLLLEEFAKSCCPAEHARPADEIIAFLVHVRNSPANLVPLEWISSLQKRVVAAADKDRLNVLLEKWAGEPRLERWLPGLIHEIVEGRLTRAPGGPEWIGWLLKKFKKLGWSKAVDQLCHQAITSVRDRAGANMATILVFALPFQRSWPRLQPQFAAQQAGKLISAFKEDDVKAIVLAKYAQKLNEYSEAPREHADVLKKHLGQDPLDPLRKAAVELLPFGRVADLLHGFHGIGLDEDSRSFAKAWLEPFEIGKRKPEDARGVFRLLLSHCPAERGSLEKWIFKVIDDWPGKERQEAQGLILNEPDPGPGPASPDELLEAAGLFSMYSLELFTSR